MKLVRAQHASPGFTLIEFLIYFSILAVMLIAADAIFFNILFGKAKQISIEEVNQNARHAMEKMVEAINNAEAINSP